MTSTRKSLAIISQLSFQIPVSGEGILLENIRSHFPLWLLHYDFYQILFSFPSKCTSAFPSGPSSSSVLHSLGHLSVPFPPLQITQKLCAFYHERKINTFVLCFFHAWLNTPLPLLLMVWIAGETAGKKSNHSFTKFLSIMICSSNTFPVFWEFSIFQGKVNKSCNSYECSIFDNSQGYQINGQHEYYENTVQEKGKAMLPGKMHRDKMFQLEMYFAALLLALCLPSCEEKG